MAEGWHDWRLWFYFVNLLLGGAGLTVMLATIFWPWNKMRCNPVLTSFLFTWFLTTFPCLGFLLYAGQVVGPPPSQSVCLASATLVMAQTDMAVVSSLALVAHVWSLLARNVRHRFIMPWILRPSVLVAAPYVTFFAVALAVVGVGIAQPANVHRVLFYCVVDIRPFLMCIGVLTSVLLIVTIVFEVLLLRDIRKEHQNMFAQDIDPQLLIRVVAFGFYVFLALVLGVVSAINWTSVIPDLLLSTYPLAICIVFGSQKPFMHRWMTCLRRPEREQHVSLELPASESRTGSSRRKTAMTARSSAAAIRLVLPWLPKRSSVPTSPRTRLPAPQAPAPAAAADGTVVVIGSLDPFAITTVGSVMRAQQDARGGTRQDERRETRSTLDPWAISTFDSGAMHDLDTPRSIRFADMDASPPPRRPRPLDYFDDRYVALPPPVHSPRSLRS